jgi:hypothetical protein
VRRIQAELGGDWPATGPDGVIAGDPSTVVKGIATTAMATLDVLKQAAGANANLILTYEPTFYGRADGRPAASPTPGRGPMGLSPDDPVAKAKREFIAKNGLVVFRLRDHWQARKESEMAAAFAGALGWSNRRVKSDDALYDLRSGNDLAVFGAPVGVSVPMPSGQRRSFKREVRNKPTAGGKLPPQSRTWSLGHAPLLFPARTSAVRRQILAPGHCTMQNPYCAVG